MRATVETVKKYFKRGLYTLTQINAMLQAGKISEEEYAYIVGDTSQS